MWYILEILNKFKVKFKSKILENFSKILGYLENYFYNLEFIHYFQLKFSKFCCSSFKFYSELRINFVESSQKFFQYYLMF